MFLYGEQLTRREVEKRLSRVEQVFGAERYQMSEGFAAGADMIRVRTGAGLCFDISVSKGFDIYSAEFHGVPIGWYSANGNVHPAYYNAFQNEWTRAVAGGLLFTCGLRQVGTACEENGVFYAQHGRIHNSPSKHVSIDCNWENDEYTMKIKAVVEETAMFGENLRMTREYLCNAGKNEMRIFDTVENIGFSTEQLMLNYHFNFGYPFVSEHTKVESATDTVLPQKDYMPKKGYEDFAVPTDGHPSLVYYHGVGESDDAFAEIINPEFPVMNGKVRMPVKVRLKWSSVDLPNMVHWKMPASGNYVLGIQPANCLVDGRVKEKENGTAIYLEPGRKMTYQLGLELE